MNVYTLGLFLGFLCCGVHNAHATDAPVPTESEKNENIFIDKVKERKQKGKDTYLVLGEQGKEQLSPGASICDNKMEYNRFGDERWTFFDRLFSAGSYGRTGICADVENLKVWAKLAQNLPNHFTYIVDDWHLLKDLENSKEIGDRKKILDHIHTILQENGVFVVPNVFSTKWCPTDEEINDICEKFDVYLATNPIACFPHGKIGNGISGSHVFAEDTIKILQTFESTDTIIKQEEDAKALEQYIYEVFQPKEAEELYTALKDGKKTHQECAKKILFKAAQNAEEITYLLNFHSKYGFFVDGSIKSQTSDNSLRTSMQSMKKKIDVNNDVIKKAMSFITAGWNADNVTNNTENFANKLDIEYLRSFIEALGSIKNANNKMNELNFPFFIINEAGNFNFILKKKEKTK
ncbi:MAG: hypothetical protein LBJ71_03690 [Holosporaceae bacterium]|jgi:hypothetical protein|nr:hypothetical protein [Holosporaceae bacterium]